MAGRVFDRLKTMGYRVFLDFSAMREGEFEEQIYKAIDASEDVLVVLSPNGLDRCINEEKDYVRKEIAHALKQNKNVIPLRMRDFKFPNNLPEDVKKIEKLHGPEVSEEYYDSFIQSLVEKLHSKPEDKSQIAQLQQDITNGQRFISNRLYDKAMECLDRAMQVEPANPEAYFWGAVALLQGKRPFLVDRASIRRAEEYLNVALSAEQKPIYSYFLAYIKYDYYDKKMLTTTPNYQKYLADATEGGISQDDIAQLFQQLGTKRPDDF